MIYTRQRGRPLYLRKYIGGTMRTYNFKVMLEPDETGGYVVSCPSLPGCYSQGDTAEEALTNIKEAILLCLEDMEAMGEEIPDPSKTVIETITVTK